MSTTKELIDDEICCANCGIPASELYEKLPEACYMLQKWYCSEGCYDEATQHEG